MPRGPGRALVIPFEYAAKFVLSGRPGNVVQDVITIRPDGTFVAVAIGYGFDAERGRPIEILNPPNSITPVDITLEQLPRRALVEGFQVNPRSENIVFQGDVREAASVERRERKFSGQSVPPELQHKCFQRVKPVEDISFLFSMVDSGSGRELQDEPTHNVASLGISNGERPFRPLAQPVSFLPRSTIRMQVIEKTEDAIGTLFIVLFGYEVLVGSACPEPIARALTATAGGRRAPGTAGPRIIPFDYVAKFSMTGFPGNRLEDEVPVHVEGGFIATAIGYGLAPGDQSVQILWDRLPKEKFGAVYVEARALTDPASFQPEQTSQVDLGKVPLQLFHSSALIDGIRIRAEYLRFAFASGGSLASVPRFLAEEMFERLNQPEDVGFRYTISDTGTGRDWQNQPIHNIAGLGIANGLRPFKRLARPMIFLPRSTIRVVIEERFGSGTLFLAFQGYKILGAPAAGGRS